MRTPGRSRSGPRTRTSHTTARARRLAALTRASPPAAVTESQTIADELGLHALVVEAGPIVGGAGAKVRHFLKVHDVDTGEECLYWEEPRDQRTTEPDKATDTDALTKKLHNSFGPPPSRPSSVASGSAPGTPR